MADEPNGVIDEAIDAETDAGDNPHNLKPQQEKALVALLNEPTIARAARAAGIGERTLHKWIRQPNFAEAFRDARRQMFNQAIALTQRYSSLAVQTLANVMTNPSAPWTCKVSAAIGILRFSREGIELEDLQERVVALETAAGVAPSRSSPMVAMLRARAAGKQNGEVDDEV